MTAWRTCSTRPTRLSSSQLSCPAVFSSAITGPHHRSNPGSRRAGPRATHPGRRRDNPGHPPAPAASPAAGRTAGSGSPPGTVPRSRCPPGGRRRPARRGRGRGAGGRCSPGGPAAAGPGVFPRAGTGAAGPGPGRARAGPRARLAEQARLARAGRAPRDRAPGRPAPATGLTHGSSGASAGIPFDWAGSRPFSGTASSRWRPVRLKDEARSRYAIRPLASAGSGGPGAADGAGRASYSCWQTKQIMCSASIHTATRTQRRYSPLTPRSCKDRPRPPLTSGDTGGCCASRVRMLRAVVRGRSREQAATARD